MLSQLFRCFRVDRVAEAVATAKGARASFSSLNSSLQRYGIQTRGRSKCGEIVIPSRRLQLLFGRHAQSLSLESLPNQPSA